MASSFVVDGYNVIRRVERLKRAEIRKGLEAGRDALFDAILESGVLRSSRVVVVFDGSSGGPPSVASPHPRLSARFSVPPENADALILSLVKKSPAKEAITVVTADRDLGWELRRLGARVVRPEEWLRPRGPRPARRRARAVSTDEKPSPDASEVAYWLEVFGGGSD